VLLGELQAGLHEQLLQERVADLDGGTPLLRALVQLDAGEGGAVDALTSGLPEYESSKATSPPTVGTPRQLP
jgi:hypothetical protein